MNREPAFFVGLLGAVLALLLSFGVPGLSNETVALIMAFVNAALGFYVAWKTNETLLGVGVALTNAAVALAAGYGFNMTEAQTAAIIGLVSVILGAWQRTQVAPLVRGTFAANRPAA